MRTQWLGLLLGLVVVSAMGDPAFAGFTGVSVVVFGSVFAESYRYRRRRHLDRLLPPRRNLDRVVIGQLAILMAVSVATITLWTTSQPPWDAPFPLQVIACAAAIVAGVVYSSSLVDWYWILPKVSGLTGTAPCVMAGGEGFAGVTKVWLFHRAICTLVVASSFAAVTGYLAPDSATRALAATVSVLGALASAFVSELNGDPFFILRHQFQNPSVTVGQVISMPSTTTVGQADDAYIVDASMSGFQYRRLPNEGDSPDAPVRFRRKGEDLSFERAAEVLSSPRTKPVCADVNHCTAVNFYCFRNPNANDSQPETEALDKVFPAPLPGVVATND